MHVLASAAVMLVVMLMLLAVRRGQRRRLLLLLLLVVVVVEQVHLAGGVGRGKGAMVTVVAVVVVVAGEVGVHWKGIKYQEWTNITFCAKSPGFCRCARFPLGGGGGGGGPSSSSSSSSCGVKQNYYNCNFESPSLHQLPGCQRTSLRPLLSSPQVCARRGRGRGRRRQRRRKACMHDIWRKISKKSDNTVPTLFRDTYHFKNPSANIGAQMLLEKLSQIR